jgi:hypothetical protein
MPQRKCHMFARPCCKRARLPDDAAENDPLHAASPALVVPAQLYLLCLKGGREWPEQVAPSVWAHIAWYDLVVCGVCSMHNV